MTEFWKERGALFHQWRCFGCCGFLPTCGQSGAKIGPTLADIAARLANSGADSAAIGTIVPGSDHADRCRPKCWQCRPVPWPNWPDLARMCSSWCEFGQVWCDFDQNGAMPADPACHAEVQATGGGENDYLFGTGLDRPRAFAVLHVLPSGIRSPPPTPTSSVRRVRAALFLLMVHTQYSSEMTMVAQKMPTSPQKWPTSPPKWPISPKLVERTLQHVWTSLQNVPTSPEMVRFDPKVGPHRLNSAEI